MRLKQFLVVMGLLLGWGQILFATTQTVNEIIQQEFQQTTNPQEVVKAVQQALIESEPNKQLQLILTLLTQSLSKEKQPYLWAMFHGTAGYIFQELHNLNRADNLEEAITHYQLALEVYTLKAFPQEWAMMQNNLAAVYSDRIRGERADNLEEAITHYQLALKVRTRAAFPQDWAATQHNLANAYNQRIHGERADNLEQAIALYKLALGVYTRVAFPEKWAQTQNNLATTYRDRIHGERADNLEKAIALYQLALEVYTRAAFSQDWAMTQNNLATAYFFRIRGKRADNLEKAIDHYQLALEVYTRAAFPQDWAMTQDNLASAYLFRIRGERADNIEQAIAHYQLALEVRTRVAFPQDWAATQHNLANAYNQRIHGERADNLEQAIALYKLALEVRTRAAFPQDWAATQHNLANAYNQRIRGERADNLEEAITNYQLTLEVYTRKAFPEQWAATQNGLAVAYFSRIRGERADNIEQAIAHYQLALEVRTRAAFPQDWAMTQNNLASAYLFRIRGERADNLEQAIAHYQLALKVRTRAAFPQDWAGTQNDLAIAYGQRIRGKRADNLEEAITHSQLALKVYTRVAFPQDWAATQNNLANAYSDRIRGKRTNNLEEAITYYQLALEVRTRAAFPQEFIETTANLSDALLKTAQWSKALTHLQTAIETNEDLLQQISFTPEERQRLVQEAEDLFANAIWAASQDQSVTDALRFLEWGKTRLLRQNLAIDSVNLQQLPPEQQAQLQQLNNTVKGLEIQLQNPQQTNQAILSSLRTELKDKRQQLRKQLQQSGITTAIQAPQLETLYQWLETLPSGSLVIAPIFTDFGTVVFLIPAGTTAITAQHLLVLPNFSRKDLQTATRGTEQDQWKGYVYAYWQWNGETDPTARGQKQQAWQTQLDATLEQLRTVVMQPIFAKLTELQIPPGAHLFWMPDSDSSLLPIHAITIEQQPFLARYTIHFIPSLYNIYTAQQRLAKVTDNTLLALINPTENLAFAPVEGEIVTGFFPKQATTLAGKAGTYAQLIQAFTKKPTYLHLSTHGRYDWATPLDSGLALANGEHLTLKDLVSKINLEGNRLTVLSACETGITDINMPTEAMGLPAAFLQAGVPGVISTLWTVSDQSTTFLLGKFYELHRTQGIEPAKALAQAQEWLRTATYRDLQNWLSGHLPERNSPQFARVIKLLTDLRKLSAQKAEEQPYAASYYWAAFIYTGV
jgi:CHAT domain-containing protein/tetratricopeptide (TPR) repeat protein